MKSLSLIVLLCILSWSGVCHAQLTWSVLATAPGPVRSFALASDGTLYVLAPAPPNPGSVLYFSTDKGGHWSMEDTAIVLNIACDSNGGVARTLSYGKVQFKSSRLASWQQMDLDPNDRNIQFSRTAFYILRAPVNTVVRVSDSGQSRLMDTLESAEIYDVPTIITGDSDRLIALLQFESDFRLFDQRLIPAVDSENHVLCFVTDNAPPRDVFFGQDRYVYMNHLCGLERLAPDSHVWEIYDSANRPNPEYHVPFASLNATTLVSLDTGGTYTSTDHGDSWMRIGAGIQPDGYPTTLIFDNSGRGYAVVADSLYTASYFAGVTQPSTSDNAPLNVYPNPSSTSVRVDLENISQIKVFNMLGTLCQSVLIRTPGASSSIDVSGLAAGAYRIVAIQNGKERSATFVKE